MLRGKCGLIVIFCITLFISQSDASAQSQMKCLENSKGQMIKWRANWQSDNKDNDVEYNITNVSVINKIPVRIVTLDLKAVKEAFKPSRTVEVKAEDTARAFCQRLAPRDVAPLSFPEGGSISGGLSSEETPFITYSGDSWYLAELTATTKLVECQILSKRFKCEESQKKMYGDKLKDVEEEIRFEQQMVN